MKQILKLMWIIVLILILPGVSSARPLNLEGIVNRKDMLIVENQSGQGSKVVYLTFDDGPSNVTDKVLDILKEQNVKATFFIIGNQIDQNLQVVQRICRDGHSIGLHTYTHQYKNIYKNEDAFINEMLKSRDKVYEVTGITSNIIRFPGGSDRHLTGSCLKKLHNCNFKIYDWNMDATDGLYPKASPQKLYKRATRQSKELDTVVVLLHCDYNHQNTCKALPAIIKFYKDKSYEFKAVTEETQELHFPVKSKK